MHRVNVPFIYISSSLAWPTSTRETYSSRAYKSQQFGIFSKSQARRYSYILDSFKFQVKIDHVQLLSSVNTFTAFPMYRVDYSVFSLQLIVPCTFTSKSEGGNDGPTRLG